MNQRFGGLGCACVVFAALSAAGFGKFNAALSVGDKAPSWPELPAADGKSYALADFDRSDVLVVAFIANQCPTSTMYEDRLIALQKDYAKRSVQLVAVSVSTLPGDRLECMKERAAERKYGFPYLHDATQKIGRDYGASVTPEVFVLDRRRHVAYLGPWDDNADAAKAQRHYVRDAVDALLAGEKPAVTERRPRGCEIEYEEK